MAGFQWRFELEELEDGFRITIKGDKDEVRPKLEAIKAFVEFKEKAREAGLDHMSWMHGHSHRRTAMHALHEHMIDMHRRRHGNCDGDNGDKGDEVK